MTFSWDRNLARGTIFAPADPRQLDWTLCSLSPSLATRCNQKICRRARDINPKYFTFNCCKRRGWDGKMGRWACRGLHGGRRRGEFMETVELEQKMRCMNMEPAASAEELEEA